MAKIYEGFATVELADALENNKYQAAADIVAMWKQQQDMAYAIRQMNAVVNFLCWIGLGTVIWAGWNIVKYIIWHLL